MTMKHSDECLSPLRPLSRSAAPVMVLEDGHVDARVVGVSGEAIACQCA